MYKNIYLLFLCISLGIHRIIHCAKLTLYVELYMNLSTFLEDKVHSLKYNV